MICPDVQEGSWRSGLYVRGVPELRPRALQGTLCSDCHDWVHKTHTLRVVGTNADIPGAMKFLRVPKEMSTWYRVASYGHKCYAAGFDKGFDEGFEEGVFNGEEETE